MNKIYMIIGAALLLSATACQKGLEGNQAGDSSEISLYAELPQTKTTLLPDDGYKVMWTKDDQIAVFNAPTGTAEYSGNLHFKIDGDATGKFAPYNTNVEVPFEDGVNYDWFVCCPWRATNGSEELKSPKGQSGDDGYFPIGAATQNGYNSAVHISSNDIMVGKATDTRTPVVNLHHLAVLHKFTVTNKSDGPIVITKLTFNGGENKIFGTFWIDMTSDNPAIDITKANATYNERALTVKNGGELAVDASADFYVMTAPFTLNAGEVFKVTVETSIGSQVIEKTAQEDIEFAAGTYNTANLVYDYKPAYADLLYEDTFNGTFENSANVSTSNTTFTPARWDTYDKGGMTVYDGNKTAVNYTRDDKSTLTRQVASTALAGMDDLHVRFIDGGVLTVSGIKLYGKTDLELSFVQTYKSAGIKAEYSVDNGTTWEELGTSTLENRTYAHNALYKFSVAEGSQTISLRFTATSTPRIDNIKLTWQEVE